MNFLKFLVTAKRNTYAISKSNNKKILEDGTKELNFSQNEFKYRDRYFGSNPFIGEEVVWEKDKIVWGMNYYGFITSKIIPIKIIYQFLKIALQKVTEDLPFRGPKRFLKGGFEYLNKNEGDLNLFSGVEIIKYRGKEVYRLYYHGGKM